MQIFDIFCAVIDNFGDAGVCWRLARQLAQLPAVSVRLWIDQPRVLDALCAGETWPNLQVADWPAAQQVAPGNVVIEAFACSLPSSWLSQLTAQTVWLNLEYLSAENWVEGCHGLPSPPPQGVASGVRKHFFFPGFSAATGGLLCEPGLVLKRQAFQRDVQAQAAFWLRLGVTLPPDALPVSLFAYENTALAELLTAWSQALPPVLCVVPVGRVLPQVAAWAGQPLQVGDVVQRGSLTLHVLPFLSQADYDYLLWACVLNFVRGEDSFVRAQWAGAPFVWHIYQQEDGAHHDKLQAFLARYSTGLSAQAAQSLQDFSLAWEAQQGVAVAWPALLAALPELRQHTERWAASLLAQGDLVSKLLIFCQKLLQ